MRRFARIGLDGLAWMPRYSVRFGSAEPLFAASPFPANTVNVVARIRVKRVAGPKRGFPDAGGRQIGLGFALASARGEVYTPKEKAPPLWPAVRPQGKGPETCSQGRTSFDENRASTCGEKRPH